MCHNDMIPYRKSFDEACAAFGWKKETIKRYHERDDERSWTEDIWVNMDGEYLFDESDLEEGLVQEFIRLSKLVGKSAK